MIPGSLCLLRQELLQAVDVDRDEETIVDEFSRGVGGVLYEGGEKGVVPLVELDVVALHCTEKRETRQSTTTKRIKSTTEQKRTKHAHTRNMYNTA